MELYRRAFAPKGSARPMAGVARTVCRGYRNNRVFHEGFKEDVDDFMSTIGLRINTIVLFISDNVYMGYDWAEARGEENGNG